MKKLLLWAIAMTLLISIAWADCISLNDAVAYYTFDDADCPDNCTNVANESVGNLTSSGLIIRSSAFGFLGEGYQAVDGQGLLDTANKFCEGSSAITVSLWVNQTTSGQNRGIIGGDTHNAIYFAGSSEAADNSPTFGLDETFINAGTGVSITTNVWEHYLLTWNDITAIQFQDGVEVVEVAKNTGALSLSADFKMGDADGQEVQTTNFDEVGIWCRNFTLAEIADLYNSGDGCQPYVAPPVSDSSKIDLLFANETAITTYKTTFDEGEDFHVLVNWTNSTGTSINDSNGNCTISILDGIVEIAGEFDNFTLCDSGCNFSTRSREFDFEIAVNAVNDSLHFLGCHEQTASGNMEINISCSAGNEILTVDATEMPLCSSGTALIRKTTSVCIGDTLINISTDTAGNIPFSQRKRILDAAADREYSVDVNTYPSFTFFNDTTGFWQTNHTHEFYAHGSKEIFANCTHTNINLSNSTTENITIVNVPPQIFIEQVETSLGVTDLSEGVVIEFANGTWQWLLSVVDDDLQFINYTWFNSTGIQIFSATATGTPSIINTTSTLFVDFDGNPFNLTIFANDTNGNSTTATITFNVTDTTNPSCNFASSYKAFINRSFSFNVTCTDENFFELNVTCPNNNFTNFTTGLNVPSFNFLDTIGTAITDTCSFRYCDGHTTLSLESDWIVYPDNEKRELFKDGKNIGVLWVDDGEIELEKGIDRYKFKVRFNSIKPYQSIYFNSTGNPVYLKDDKYLGWLVDSSNKVWIDMNNDFNIPMTVIKRAGGLWEYRLVTDEEEVKFESIGELNCVSGSFSLEDQFSNYGIYSPNTCWIDDTLQNAFIFAFTVFFIAMIFVLNECIIRFPLLNFLVGLSFIFLSVSMWACSQLIMIPFLFFGLSVWWYEISLIGKGEYP